MKITFCILTLLLFVLPCYSQKTDDILGWQDARWGMTEEELKTTFNADLKKLVLCNHSFYTGKSSEFKLQFVFLSV